MKGYVKWFDAGRGYGFITGRNGEEIFVHHSAIDMPGYRKLLEAQEVDYEVEETERGLNAVLVKVMS